MPIPNNHLQNVTDGDASAELVFSLKEHQFRDGGINPLFADGRYRFRVLKMVPKHKKDSKTEVNAATQVQIVAPQKYAGVILNTSITLPVGSNAHTTFLEDFGASIASCGGKYEVAKGANEIRMKFEQFVGKEFCGETETKQTRDGDKSFSDINRFISLAAFEERPGPFLPEHLAQGGASSSGGGQRHQNTQAADPLGGAPPAAGTASPPNGAASSAVGAMLGGSAPAVSI